jgi:hypothetical protein
MAFKNYADQGKMKHIFLFIIVFAQTLFVATKHRSKVNFNKSWKFILDSVQQCGDPVI